MNGYDYLVARMSHCDSQSWALDQFAQGALERGDLEAAREWAHGSVEYDHAAGAIEGELFCLDFDWSEAP